MIEPYIVLRLLQDLTKILEFNWGEDNPVEFVAASATDVGHLATAQIVLFSSFIFWSCIEFSKYCIYWRCRAQRTKCHAIWDRRMDTTTGNKYLPSNRENLKLSKSTILICRLKNLFYLIALAKA